MTREDSPYFSRPCETAPFTPERMGERDIVSTESLSCCVNALEPGQRFEPGLHEHADRLHIVLRGHGAFVVGDSRQVLGPGEVALAPAGTSHRAFANQDERLVLLAVTSPISSRAGVHPASHEPGAPVVADPAIERPSPAEAPPVASGTTLLPSLPARTVPVTVEPAGAPLELPVTRLTTPTVRTPRPTASAIVSPSSGFARILDSLRAPKASSADGLPPVIPEATRCAPRSSRVRAEAVAAPQPEPPRINDGMPPPRKAPEIPQPTPRSPVAPPVSGSASSGSGGPSKGSDMLPDIFRKLAKSGAR